MHAIFANFAIFVQLRIVRIRLVLEALQCFIQVLQLFLRLFAEFALIVLQGHAVHNKKIHIVSFIRLIKLHELTLEAPIESVDFAVDHVVMKAYIVIARDHNELRFTRHIKQFCGSFFIVIPLYKVKLNYFKVLILVKELPTSQSLHHLPSSVKSPNIT